MKKLRGIALLLLSAALIVSAAGCGQSPYREQEAFDAFIRQEFIQTMESSYLTTHTYMQDPAAFGVDTEKIEVNLGPRPGNETETDESYGNSYETFQKFRRENLTEEQKDIYDICAYHVALNQHLGDEKFDYYGSYFESMGGIHFQLPNLFSDWQMRSEADAQNLITLLYDTKPYVDSILEYTKQQEERGLLMLDLDSIIAHCDRILQSGENSAILASVNDSIDGLSLPAETAAAYKSQAKEAFASSFLPAFENIRSVMEAFRQNGKNHTGGLAELEHGRAYYELLLKQSIGSDKSVEEVRTMMEEAFDQHLYQFAKIVLTSPEAVEPLMAGTVPTTQYQSYTEILDDMKQMIAAEFPPVSNLDYHIENVNEELASDSGITAYFMIPTLDGDSVNQLRVNPLSNDVSSISTFLTVAHEGFPGHMYQYAYMYENVESDYLKAFAGITAFVEGYAVYAQYEALDYLDEIDRTLLEAYKENELATYCLMILADIGIHYDGWDVDTFGAFLEEKGIVMDQQAVQTQYIQLQANPAAFASYYVGYHEILSMKEDAKARLGSLYDEKEFHTALLESGVAPFAVIQRHIEAYIARKTGAQAVVSAAA